MNAKKEKDRKGKKRRRIEQNECNKRERKEGIE